MIADVIDVLALVLALFVATYLAIFCGMGALLARSRGASAAWGAALGVLGPFGLGWIAWRTRGSSSTDSDVADDEPSWSASPDPEAPASHVPGGHDF